MVWKALEALGILSEALGGFDVNTVYVPHRVHGSIMCCMHFYLFFSEVEVNFVCMFTGFAESRPWECRVFSFEIAPTSQKSRVVPFSFVPTPRKSHDLHVNLFIFV